VQAMVPKGEASFNRWSRRRVIFNGNNIIKQLDST
jgi:hypothetical protein